MIKQSILYKIRCLQALYDVFWPSYINFSEGQKLFFLLFPLGKTKKRLLRFTKIDVTRSKNVVESSETSHFVENWLLYRYRLLKQKIFRNHWSKNQGFLEN